MMLERMIYPQKAKIKRKKKVTKLTIEMNNEKKSILEGGMNPQKEMPRGAGKVLLIHE